MERIGLLSKDLRLKNDLRKWFSEIPGKFEFVDLGPPATGDPPAASAAENPDSKKMKLVIFDASFSKSLSQLRNELKLHDTPWLAIGLEEHAKNPHAPAVNGADDLILTPLDKSVFLQKVEYLLSGGTAVSPSFLYLAKADLQIELAKTVHITHLSETGCTILSQRPVANGVEGTLISKIFGDDRSEQIEVRAIESTPCFDSSIATTTVSEPRFEVKLRYFGLKHKQLIALRKWLIAHQKRRPGEIERSKGEPRAVMHVAMISPQVELASQLRSSLEDLAKVEVDEFQGLRRFQSQLQARAPKTGANAPEPQGPLSALLWTKEFVGPKQAADMIPALPHPQVTMNVRLQTDQVPSHVETFAPVLRQGETILGANSEQWGRDLGILSKGLSESDREALDEAILWTVSNSTLTYHPETRLTAYFTVTEAIKLWLSIKISLIEEKSPSKPALIKIQIEEDLIGPKQTQKQKTPYEAILIDASLLTFEIKEQITSVTNWLEFFDIKSGFGNRPPIIVFNAKEDKVPPQVFRGTAVQQLVYDFSDRRYQAELFVSLSRPELWTSPNLEVADLRTDLKAYLARPAHASGVSEVSLVLEDHAPMKIGTELLVISPLWSQAPDGLWARLRFASPKGEGKFANEFVFFGVSDVVQKEIRKFAREDYIKKKAQGQG